MEKLSRHPWIAAILIYSVFSFLYFIPALPHLTTELIGPPEDNTLLLWNMWYAAKALHTAEVPLMHTVYMYFPEGTTLYYNLYFYFGGFLYAALKNLVPLVIYYNGMVIATFIFSSLTAFLLLRYLTRNTLASLIGGFIFGFSPQHYARSLHHLHLASMQFIPLYVLFLFKIVREDKKRHVIYAALTFILICSVSWNYGISTALFTGLACVWLFWKLRLGFVKRVLPRLLGVGVICFGGLAYWILPMINLGRKFPQVKLDGFDTHVINVVNFFIPQPLHWIRESPFWSHVNHYTDSWVWECAAYLGIFNLVILVLARKFLWQNHRKYLLGLVTFMVLSLGVSIHIHEWKIPMLLPYDLLRHLPFFAHARNPSRMMVYVYLFLAILVAFSIKGLWLEKALTLKRKGLLAFVALLIFVDFYSVSAVTTPVKLPPAYEVIQGDPDSDFGILELPWQGGIYLMYQTTHERPIVQGYIGRKMNTTLLQRIPFEPPGLEKQKAMLREHNVKYVVIHKRLLWDQGRHYRDLPIKGREIISFRNLQMLADAYARIYDRVYDDQNHSVFKVY